MEEIALQLIEINMFEFSESFFLTALSDSFLIIKMPIHRKNWKLFSDKAIGLRLLPIEDFMEECKLLAVEKI